MEGLRWTNLVVVRDGDDVSDRQTGEGSQRVLQPGDASSRKPHEKHVSQRLELNSSFD